MAVDDDQNKGGSSRLLRRREMGSKQQQISFLVVEPLLLYGWLENLERAHQSLVDAHHGCGVIKFIACVEWERTQ